MFIVYEGTCFGPSSGLLGNQSTNDAYMLGSQICLQLVFVEYIQQLIE